MRATYSAADPGGLRGLKTPLGHGGGLRGLKTTLGHGVEMLR